MEFLQAQSRTSQTDLPEQLLEKAIAAGAEAAEVFQTSTLSQPVIFEGNRLKQIETSQSEGMAVRLWRNGQPGLAVGYGPVDPQALVDKALSISTLNAPEAPNLKTGGPKSFPAVGETAAVEQLVAWGQGAIAHLRDQFLEIVCEAELACEVEHTRLINSTGLDYRAQDTSLGGYISAELIDQDDFLCVGDGTVNRYPIEMDAAIDTITTRMAERIQWANRTANPPAGSVPVIFTPAAAWLLWDTLRAALNGKRIREGTSPWSQKWNERVTHPTLNLRQDPTVGPYSCPFDDEGMLTQPLLLVEDGRVKNWYCDRSRPIDASPIPGLSGSTGNGIRPDLGSYPTPGLINLLVSPGELSWRSLIAQQSDAIIVDQVMGEGGDLTGDLSVNLELGYRVRDGEIVGRVKDTMVSGNAYTALDNLIALSSEAEWSGSTYTPAVAVGGLSVTG
ncbi:MAG: TldD/PmbA family protein [Phormidesmis sp.]